MSKKRAVTVFSAGLVGVDAKLIAVEADQRSGYVATHIVGLPDKACAEAKERVRSALRNSSIPLPQGQVVFNLAPAELPKSGSGYDLPMAMALVIRRGVIPDEALKQTLVIGELALDGNTRPVKGVLAACQLAKQLGFTNIIIPYDNAAEAALISGINIYPAKSLSEAIGHCQGLQLIAPLAQTVAIAHAESLYDFQFIKGHSEAKRAMEIAALGRHNVLLSGPPGSGKTMLAKSITSILLELSIDEFIEVTKIHSAAGLLSPSDPFQRMRPFRHPHHSASAIALVGGGSYPKPGEISLAHNGVLFLDELPEFPRKVLDMLRQPLEDGIITVSRANQTIDFPARFMLVAAMNPCPCGYKGDQSHDCLCSASQVSRYQQRLSGPLLDRFDIFLHVPKLNWHELGLTTAAESSQDIQKRLSEARSFRDQRMLAVQASTRRSADQQLVIDCTGEARKLLASAGKQLDLSNRAHFRLLRVARSIADLGQSLAIEEGHIAEALQYRKRGN